MTDDANPEAGRSGPGVVSASVAASVCGWASVALGAAVLVGWAFGVDVLIRVLPGMVSLKPNTALAFLLAGLALRSIRSDRPPNRWAIGLSVAVAVIGGLTLFEYFSGVDLGIDQLIAREPTEREVGSIRRGRMHQTSAFDFVLLGIALALVASDRRPIVAHSLALLAALIASMTLIGYLYGVREFLGWAAFGQMAPLTTAGMIALAAGAILARPGSGLSALLLDPGPGGMMVRKLLPVAILMPIVVNGLALIAHDAGWFDEPSGTAVRASVMVALLVAFIGQGAYAIRRVDRDRGRAEVERLEVERRWRTLTEALPQIAWCADADGSVEYINRRWFDYTGQDPGQTWDWRLALHPDDLAGCLEAWERSRVTGEPFQGEHRLRRSDGSYRWHLVRAEPLRDESGRVAQWVGTSTDVHTQKLASDRRYRSLVEATASIVWDTPGSGLIDSELPGWAAFTGQTFDQYKGWGWLDAVHPDDRAETARVWSEAVERHGAYRVEHRLRRSDGQYRHMSVRGVPLLDENYSIVEWIGVHTDVDDQKRAEEAMCRAKEAAESATRAKSEFLANMSHEIRTPMNGILGMTELALSTDLSTVQREYLGLVKSSADALLTVINDILDFSKIEAGKLDLEPVRFSPRDMVNDALRTLAIRAHEKGLELASRIAPGVPEAVLGDPGRLRQVLVNLVGNAIKFTERGEVIVNVGVGGPDDPPGELHFEVADTGIGIPADKRAAIFAPFEQADGSTTRRYGGTGLGLTISARLIALMGGRIWVEDNPGGGSRFRFNARLGPDPEAQLGPATASPILLDGLRVLVVDDNRTNRLILVEVLSQWGCQPVEAPGGPEAIEALGKAADRGEAFTLVLLDRMMPDMDGCELAGLIRGDARFGSPRMLMLTSAGPDDASQLRELGIDGWLAKPIRQSRLLNAMLDVLGSTDPNKAPILVEPVRLAPPIPRLGRSLRVLLAEDHPINQKVAARMLEDQGHKVTVVGDGRKAVEATAAQRFDVVLMDVQMPEMDGFEATAAIRAREALTGSARLPIIALTAHAMAGDRERCLRAGCDDYLSKPVDAASIARALARVVGETPSRTDPAPIDEPTDDRPAFDRDEALAYVCGDESLLAEILGLFLEDAPRLRAEIRAAIESRDAPTLARLAHTVVGVAGNFAAWRLVESARKLEAMGKTGELAGAGDVLGALEREFDRFRRAVEAARSDADADAATLPS